jgi:tetratricopeptide (TPR) repeat protein
MEWSTNNGKAVAALRIAGSLVYFWFIHGPLLSEWNDRIRQALSRPEGMERTLARAKALNGFGFMYWADMNPTDKGPELEEALAIGRELGDQWTIATALRNLGMLASIQRNYVEARSLLEQSLEIWREMGAEGKMGSSRTLQFLGDVALNQDEQERARSLYEESAAIWREHGEMNFLAYSLRRLGQLAKREGDYKKAVALCKESLTLNHELGDLRGMLACMAGFAAIAVAQGKFERAASLMAAVETQLSSNRLRLLFLDKMEYERNLALLRAQLDEKNLNKFRAKGRGMSLDEAIAFALEET